MRKNVFINKTSPIDGRLTAIASDAQCMTTITSNSILHQSTQLLPQSKLLQHSHSINTHDNPKIPSLLHGTVPINGIIGHNNSNNISGSNCHSTINQTKINQSLTMSQLSTVYATKRRRRNGKR